MGELRFVLSGFLIQGVAVVFEAYKNALQQSLLGGKTKMSSMTLLYHFAPACTAINAFYILLFEYSTLQTRKPSNIGPLVFLANGLLTFALNIASVTVVSISHFKETIYMLMGIIVDQENLFSGLDAEWNTEVNAAVAPRHGDLWQPYDFDTSSWIQYCRCRDLSLFATK